MIGLQRSAAVNFGVVLHPRLQCDTRRGCSTFGRRRYIFVLLAPFVKFTELHFHRLPLSSAPPAYSKHLSVFVLIMSDSLRAPEPSYFTSPLWKSRSHLDSPSNSTPATPGSPGTPGTPGTPNEGTSLIKEKLVDARDLKRSLFKLNRPSKVRRHRPLFLSSLLTSRAAEPVLQGHV